MYIATIDIGGTSVKFATMTPQGELVDKTTLATPNHLDDLLAWFDEKIQEKDYQGIAMSVPGAVNQQTGVIGGISAVPYIHGFSWYDCLAKYGLSVTLENDANCVGLSELLAQPRLQNLACVVIGTGIGGAMILNGKLHRGKHHLGGEFGYMTLSEPKESLGNWSQLASTGQLVRLVHQKTHRNDWNGKTIYQAAAQGDQICQQAIQQVNHALALGILNIQYCYDPDAICIGGAISENPDFLNKLKKSIQDIVEQYEEYTVTPEILACTYKGDANLYGALVHWLQEEGKW